MYRHLIVPLDRSVYARRQCLARPRLGGDTPIKGEGVTVVIRVIRHRRTLLNVSHYYATRYYECWFRNIEPRPFSPSAVVRRRWRSETRSGMLSIAVTGLRVL